MVKHTVTTKFSKIILLLGCAFISVGGAGTFPAHAQDDMTAAQAMEAEELKPHKMSEDLLKQGEVSPEQAPDEENAVTMEEAEEAAKKAARDSAKKDTAEEESRFMTGDGMDMEEGQGQDQG